MGESGNLKKKYIEAEKKLSENIEELGKQSEILYSDYIQIQELFDKIRNVSSTEIEIFNEIRNSYLSWKQTAQSLENPNKHNQIKTASSSAMGIGTGIAVASVSPTIAMGIATTFGVASTGTAISSLSGAAAVNATLAWLGGGTLAAGGSGILGGGLLLGMAGPVGWAIAAVALISGGIGTIKNVADKKRLEYIFDEINVRNTYSLNLANAEIEFRIGKLKEDHTSLNKAIEDIRSLGTDYKSMKKPEKAMLATNLNRFKISQHLLTDPIEGLKPVYTEIDLTKFMKNCSKSDFDVCQSGKNLIISLAGILYMVNVKEEDKEFLWKKVFGNKKFLSQLELSKKQFDYTVLDTVSRALEFKYKTDS